MAANIGECMEEHCVNFIWECVPIRIQKIEDGSLGKLNVTAKYNHSTEFVDEFNTVIYAIGRDAVHGKDLAGGCGRGAQPQEREAAAQRAGVVRRGQHLCHRQRAGHHGTGGQLKAAVTGY